MKRARYIQLVRGSIVAALTLMMLVLPTSIAMASPFMYMGYDTAAMGVSNSQIAYGSSASVLFTNPALMSRYAPQGSIDFLFYKPSMSINLMKRPANADVPFVMYDTKVDQATSSKDRALPTVELKNQRSDTKVDDAQYFLSLGGTMDFGFKGFRAGSIIILPLPYQVDVTTHWDNEQEQYFSNQVHFARFGEWAPMVAGILGVSYCHPSWDYISVGIALQIALSATAGMDLYMPALTANDYAKGNVNMKAHLMFRPIIGIQANPLEWLSIGLSWKLWSYIPADGSGGMLLWNYRASSASAQDSLTKWEPKRVRQEDHDYALDYEPMETILGVGAAWKDLQFQIGVTWSYYPGWLDQHNTNPEDAAEYHDINSAQEDVANIYNPPKVNGSDYAWKNTFSVTTGLTYQYFDWARASMGFGFFPSPVPMQDGRTNYADSDVWNISVGHRFDFSLLDKNFHADLALQFWNMTRRTVYKDASKIIDEFPDSAAHVFEGTTVPASTGLQTNNPGFPGYTQKGWLVSGGVSVTYEF